MPNLLAYRGGGPALILHLAAVEAHCEIVASHWHASSLQSRKKRDLFSGGSVHLRRHRETRRTATAKTLARLAISIVALATATSFGTSSSHAFGDAPWCAVINTGQGDVYWDCQYPTFEACYHLGNILAGIAAFVI